MSDNKRTRRGRFGKGYYIALILCAAAIGITGYVYNRNAVEDVGIVQTENPAEAVATTQPRDVEAIATTDPREDEQISASQETQPQNVPTNLKTTWPVSGETVMDYSMEALSYNQTTRDWRVHNGMDIAAEEGTEVVAAADGEVYTIYEDDTMGTTVVIRHKNGYTTRYSSLSENLQVQVGQSVKMGQVIGTVGATALVESVLGPHVHFSVTHQDVLMDPMEFLKMQ
jgi:murein DD-endopeptidase MepM/ murein hydrolase activator NlpD